MNERNKAQKLRELREEINRLEPMFTELYLRDLSIILFENFLQVQTCFDNAEEANNFSPDSMSFHVVTDAEKEVIRNWSLRMAKINDQESEDFSTGYNCYWQFLVAGAGFSYLNTEGGEDSSEFTQSNVFIAQYMDRHELPYSYIVERASEMFERSDFKGVTEYIEDNIPYEVMRYEDVGETIDGICQARHDADAFYEEIIHTL